MSNTRAKQLLLLNSSSESESDEAEEEMYDRERVWRILQERFAECTFSPRVGYQDGSLMVWAGVPLEARTELYTIPRGSLTAVSAYARAAGKKLGHLLRVREYFSLSNLLTLYKAQIRPSLEYCSHIWGAAAPTTLSILDAVQRRAIRLIGKVKCLSSSNKLVMDHSLAVEKVVSIDFTCDLLILAFLGLGDW
nr:unnamed protein product [Callosobruchus chinensis]